MKLLIALAVPVLALYLWASFVLSADADVLQFSSGIYDMDVDDVVMDWTTFKPGSRPSVHPLAKLLIASIGRPLANMAGERLAAARIIIAVATTLNALLVASLAFQLSRRRGVAAVAGGIYAVSFSAILLGTIPEHASIAGLSAIVPLIFLNSKLDKPFTRVEAAIWVLLGAFGVAITVTQVGAWFIALGLRLHFLGCLRDSRRRTVVLGAAAVAVVAVLILVGAALQTWTYPGTRRFYEENIVRNERRWMRTQDILDAPVWHTARLVEHFALFDFAAPPPVYSDYLTQLQGWKPGQAYWVLSLEETSPGSWRGVRLPLLAGIGFLVGCGLWGLRHADRRFLAPMLFVAAQFALHFLYGREYILYSGNWHGVLVAVLVASAFCTPPRVRTWLRWLLPPLAVAMLVNNLIVLHKTYAAVAAGLYVGNLDRGSLHRSPRALRSGSGPRTRVGPGYDGPDALTFGRRGRPGEPDSTHGTFPVGMPKGIATHRNTLPAERHFRQLSIASRPGAA